MEGKHPVGLELSQEELQAINNALNEVCHGPDAIPEWEFETRMGVSKEQAITTLKRIGLALGGGR